MLYYQNIRLLCWLKVSTSTILDEEIFDNRYEVYRRDRQSNPLLSHNEGGGVLIAVHKSIKSHRVPKFESKAEDLSLGNLTTYSG
ncbi:unnamed protein product [Leptidea sinapis]|uniref:Uncharacterized protein n=1 Tax=Leptidea sinapis TaxID=189913 RepID=A0A5E4QQQ0_9NEOP|nr:unnamed protein product [Leptidea sinapis]